MFESASKSLLFSRLTAGFLLLTHYCGGQPQVVGPSQPITAISGDDIILPCHLEPAVDATTTVVEWTRLDLQPRFVHIWRSGEELLENQHPSFKDRTAVSVCRLNRGDLSLKLSNVKRSDAGKYRCFIPELERHADAIVQLVVGLVSSPGVEISKVSSGGVMLVCKSAGWYPEPEVLWLDGEGNLLSAGPTETVRGPDDLYTVSSRVTVEKRHSNSFTCRVQQKDTNQTREAHITVPVDLFMVQTDIGVRLSIFFIVLILAVVAVGLVIWKMGLNKTEITSSSFELHPLMGGEDGGNLKTKEGKIVFLDNAKAKAEDISEKNEAELKHVKQVIKTVTEQKKNLQNQKEKLILLQRDDKEMIERNNKKLKDKNKLSKDKMKKLKEAKENLEKRKEEHEELLKNTDELLEKTEEMIITMTERKGKLERDKEKLDQQLKDIKRTREKIQKKFESEQESSNQQQEETEGRKETIQRETSEEREETKDKLMTQQL